MKPSYIENIEAHRAVGCQGVQALQIEVVLSDGAQGSAIGTLAEIDIETALDTVNEKIANELIGEDARLQSKIDSLLKDLDGTPDLSHLRPEILFTVSMAVCKAASASANISLYQYLGGLRHKSIPRPIFPVDLKVTQNNHRKIVITPSPNTRLSEGIQKCRQAFRLFDSLFANLAKGKEKDNAIQNIITHIKHSKECSGIEVGIEHSDSTDKSGRGTQKQTTNKNLMFSIKDSDIISIERTYLVSDIYNAAKKNNESTVIDPFACKFHGLETFASDIAVALGSEYIKLESLSSHLTVCQLNRLLSIEYELDSNRFY